MNINFIYFTKGKIGWLLVEHEYITNLGLTQRISPKSHIDKEYVYLEHHQDADTFIAALKERSITYTIIDGNHKTAEEVQRCYHYDESFIKHYNQIKQL